MKTHLAIGKIPLSVMFAWLCLVWIVSGEHLALGRNLVMWIPFWDTLYYGPYQIHYAEGFTAIVIIYD
jgi:hypothetical protein